MPTIDRSADAIPLRDKSADRLRCTMKITGPASYTTGGESFDLTNDLPGWSQVHAMVGSVAKTSSGTTCRIVAFDRATNKMLWYDQAFAEIANGTDLSTFSIEVEFIGR